ncbi:TPA: hypothetical protein OXK62_002465 [Acinetobacter baumannii]|nr:hypothetical protein [Acinetobacter baumannii]
MLQEKGIDSVKTLSALIDLLDQLSAADRAIVQQLIDETRLNIQSDTGIVELIGLEAQKRQEQDKAYNLLSQIEAGKLGDELKNYFNTVVASQTPNIFDGLGTDIVIDELTGKSQAQINSQNLDSQTGLVKSEAVLVQGGTTLEEKLAETVNLLDYIPKNEHQSIFNNTSTYDIQSALTRAVADAQGRTIRIPKAGTYVLKTPYTGTTHLNIEGEYGVTLDVSQMITTSSYAITNSGSLTYLGNLIEAVSKKSNQLKLDSVESLKSGDWLMIQNEINSSFSGYRDYYNDGEFVQILGIDTTNRIVHTVSPTYTSHSTASTTKVYKLNSVKTHFKKIHFKGGSNITSICYIYYCDRPTLEDVTFYHEKYSGIGFRTCVNAYVRNVRGINIGTSEDDYGLVFGNSQHTRVVDSNIYSRRHAIALGGGPGLGNIPVRDFRCYNTIIKNDPLSTVGAADMHGNIEDSSYENCTIYGGTNLGGKDVFYRNCTIHADLTVGWLGFVREPLGGTFGWINCTGYSNGDPAISSRGFFDMGGNSIALSENAKEAVTILIQGGNYHLTAETGRDNRTYVGPFLRVSNNGSQHKLNCKVDSITIENRVPLSAIINTINVSGSQESDYMWVDNISFKHQIYSFIISHTVSSTNQTYRDAPHRTPEIRKTETLTFNGTTSSVIGSSVTHSPFRFPRVPSVRIDTNGQVQGKVGGKFVQATLHNATTDYSTVAVYSLDGTPPTEGSTITVTTFSSLREV